MVDFEDVDNALSESLYGLLNEAYSNSCHYKSDGLIQSIIVTSKKPIFRYDPVFKKELIEEYEDIPKEKLIITNLEKFRDIIKEISPYQNCLNFSYEIFKLHRKDYHNFSMGIFEHLIVDLCADFITNPHKNYSDEIDRFIKFYIDSIKRKRSKNHVKIYAYGITPNQDYFFGDVRYYRDFHIRRPIIDDFILTSDFPPYTIDSKISIREQNLPHNLTAILEFDLDYEGISDDAWDISWEVEHLLDILRLTGMGRVLSLKWVSWSVSTSPDQYGPVYLDKGYNCIINYNIDEGTEKQFFSLFQRLQPIVPIDIDYNLSKDLSFLDIALKWYKEALLYEVSKVLSDNRFAMLITSSVTSLEALYTNNTKDSSFNIRSRGATLLNLFGFDYEKVFEDLKIAYGIRSTVLHGSKITFDEKSLNYITKHYQNPAAYYQAILNYNRVSLLFFFLYTSDITSKNGDDVYSAKEIILNTLTNTDLSHENLKSFIEKIV